MHTILVIAGGLALLVACLLVGLRMGSAAMGAAAFLPLWLVGAGLNMWIGVARAGYSIAAELPIFLVVFGVPAAVAVLVRRYLRRASR